MPGGWMAASASIWACRISFTRRTGRRRTIPCDILPSAIRKGLKMSSVANQVNTSGSTAGGKPGQGGKNPKHTIDGRVTPHGETNKMKKLAIVQIVLVALIIALLGGV